jgi:Cys-rich protein (TIGR01571 family)
MVGTCAVVYFFRRPACCASFLVLFISVQENNVWESGLFDIFAEGEGTCLISICLPCYQYGVNYETHSRQMGNKKSVCVEQAAKYCLVWGACNLDALAVPLHIRQHAGGGISRSAAIVWPSHPGEFMSIFGSWLLVN